MSGLLRGLCGCLWPKQERKVVIVIIGLDNAGKTTLLNTLRGQPDQVSRSANLLGQTTGCIAKHIKEPFTSDHVWCQTLCARICTLFVHRYVVHLQLGMRIILQHHAYAGMHWCRCENCCRNPATQLCNRIQLLSPTCSQQQQ